MYSSRNRTFAPFHSVLVRPGEKLRFLGPGLDEGDGGIGLKDGYLVSVGNETQGWSVCDGELGEKVLAWKVEEEECDQVYLQAVGDRPY